ncbi:MAG: NAD(P)-dependent alcohol dehydrogenase [Chloroflexi bacterium]|nr:MAG: NAD(P)-dependent alcohol dehydrogenase [Chloroflexota bacterium]
MKAVVYDRYGPPDVLHIEDVAKPEPTEDELRVRVRAAAVTRGDCATRDANRRSGALVTLVSRLVSGVRRPRQPILGSEFAGEVEALGAAVDDFAVGDRVFGSTGFRFGAHAEFVCVRRDSRVAPMPAGLTFEQAAAITDGGLNSLWCLRLAQPLEERKVLVYGASGAIGSAAVQLAKHFGADVTAVCGTKNVELVRTLGAGAVIDYMKEDFTRNGRTYDVIMDAVGKHSFRRCKGSLNPGGRYLATDGLDNLVLSMWTARFGDKRVIFKLPPRYTRQDVFFLKELVESGRFHPVVDRSYPLEEVIEASRYVETEQKTGNVILTP